MDVCLYHANLLANPSDQLRQYRGQILPCSRGLQLELGGQDDFILSCILCSSDFFNLTQTAFNRVGVKAVWTAMMDLVNARGKGAGPAGTI